MPEEIGNAFIELFNKVWKKGELPEEWNKDFICPINKKGSKENVKNYREMIKGVYMDKHSK